MTDNYAVKAGDALDSLFSGPHRDKRIAQALGISARMARYLCSGNKWTAARIAQVSDLLGDAFEAAMHKPETDYNYNLRMQDMERRVLHLEEYIDQMARLLDVSEARQPANSRSVGARGHEARAPMESHSRGTPGYEIQKG